MHIRTNEISAAELAMFEILNAVTVLDNDGYAPRPGFEGCFSQTMALLTAIHNVAAEQRSAIRACGMKSVSLTPEFDALAEALS